MDHFFEEGRMIRLLAVLHPVSDYITQNAAEILMTREGEKASGVCQHSDERRVKTDAGKYGQLSFHTRFVIIEPPCGTELHLSTDAAALEVSCHAGKHFVVVRVQGVENCLRKQVLFVISFQLFLR